MLVKFKSTEAGEIMMYADLARALLQAVGKECTARGVFTQSELAGAARTLRDAVEGSETPSSESAEEGNAEPVITFGARAWPLIQMLERTATGDEKAHILWQAASDF